MNTTTWSISPTKILLIISSFFILIPASSANPCKPNHCDTDTSLGPEIRFPFRLADRDPARCGYPGFDLHCNTLNQTILNIPQSGEYVVDHIDYTAQALFINDPALCLPARILNFSLSGSRFRGVFMRNYTFLNCSSDYMDYTSARYMPLFCLSGLNYTVLAMNSHLSSAAAEVPPSCRRIASVLVPMRWTVSQFYWSSMDLREDLELIWSEPECSRCEIEGGLCGYKADSGQEIACYRPDKSAGQKECSTRWSRGPGFTEKVKVESLIFIEITLLKTRYILHAHSDRDFGCKTIHVCRLGCAKTFRYFTKW